MPVDIYRNHTQTQSGASRRVHIVRRVEEAHVIAPNVCYPSFLLHATSNNAMLAYPDGQRLRDLALCWRQVKDLAHKGHPDQDASPYDDPASDECAEYNDNRT